MENFERQPNPEQRSEEEIYPGIEEIKDPEIKEIWKKGMDLLAEISGELSGKLDDAWYAADQAAMIGKNKNEIIGLLNEAIKLFEAEIEAEKSEDKE